MKFRVFLFSLNYFLLIFIKTVINLYLLPFLNPGFSSRLSILLSAPYNAFMPNFEVKQVSPYWHNSFDCVAICSCIHTYCKVCNIHLSLYNISTLNGLNNYGIE